MSDLSSADGRILVAERQSAGRFWCWEHANRLWRRLFRRVRPSLRCYLECSQMCTTPISSHRSTSASMTTCLAARSALWWTWHDEHVLCSFRISSTNVLHPACTSTSRTAWNWQKIHRLVSFTQHIFMLPFIKYCNDGRKMPSRILSRRCTSWLRMPPKARPWRTYASGWTRVVHGLGWPMGWVGSRIWNGRSLKNRCVDNCTVKQLFCFLKTCSLVHHYICSIWVKYNILCP